MPNHRYLIPKAMVGESIRTRLLEQIDHSSDLNLIALIAPSGFGKTTLMAQHARSATGHRIWLTLNDSNADPRALVEDLVQASLEVPGLSAHHWLTTRTQSASAQADAWATDLNSLHVASCIYLDGAEVLSPSAGAWLERFAEALNPMHKILISSYVEIPLRLARGIARGTALHLNAEDLSFSLEETHGWLRTQGSDLDAVGLHRALDGWAAGLRLMTVPGRGQGPESLMREAIGRLDSDLVAYLMELSVLEVWSNASAESIGLPPPGSRLEAARKSGLPLTPLPDGSYRPHRVLIEALEAMLRLRPERHRHLHRAAATLAEHVKNPVAAMRHHQLANDLSKALELAADLSAHFEHRWEPWLVRNTLEPLADHLTSPLKRALGHSLLETGDAKRGEVLLLELARSGFSGAYMSFSLGVLALHQGKIDMVLQRAEEGVRQPDAEQHLTMLLRLKAAALANLGRYHEGLQDALEAVRRAEAMNDPFELGNALTMVEKIEMLLGHPVLAEASIDRALGLFEGLAAINQQLVLLEDKIWLYHKQGRLEAAIGLANWAVHLAEHEFLYMKAPLLLARAEVQFLRNQPSAVESDLIEALRLCPEFQLDGLKRILWSRLAETRWLQGSLRAAHEALEWAKIAPDYTANDTDLTHQMCLALFALEAGELVQAEAWFAQVQHSSQNPHQALRAQAYLLEVARLQRRLTREAVSKFNDQVLAATINPLDIDSIRLRKLGSHCQQLAWPFPLAGDLGDDPAKRVRCTIRALGTLQVHLNDKRIHLPLTRCGELLVYLAVHGSSSRDQLVNALWDGSAEQRHVEYFKVALKQLRATLAGQGQLEFPPVPISDGRYRLSDQFEIDFDVQRLRDLLQTKDMEAIARLDLTQARDFLPESNSEWATDLRLEIAEQHLEALMLRAKLLEHSDPEAAIAVVQQAIELEPMADQAWFKLIRLRLALGQVEEAERVLGRGHRLRERDGLDGAAFLVHGQRLLASSPILPLADGIINPDP